MSKDIFKYLSLLLLTFSTSFLLLYGSRVLAQMDEPVPEIPEIIEKEREDNLNNNLNPLYRIISGGNYEINLSEQKSNIYLIPLNYKVEKEDGIGFPSDLNRLQANEIAQSLNLSHVGMSVIAIARNPNELYLSLFVQGALPSQCHSIKIETKESRIENILNLNTLIYSGINRTKFCVTQNLPIEATFIISRLVPNIPIKVQINFQEFAEILWQNDELQVIHNKSLWKVTKISEIINGKTVDKNWKKQWIQGKPINSTK